jgi:O-antigen/teichoic acid export membrane protein
VLRGLLSLSPLTVLAVVTSLAQAKLLAILLGPTGTGVVALAISVLALGTALAGLGISSALLKVVAEESDDKARAWETYTIGLLTVTATGIVLSLVVLLASGLLSRTLLNDASLSSGDRRLILVAVALGIVPSAWRTASDGALKGLQTLGRYVIAGAINAVLAPLSIVGFAWALGASGAVVGLVVGQVLAAGVLFAFVASARSRAGKPRLALRRETAFPLWRRLVALGSLALLAALAATAGGAMLRIVIASTLDLRALGLFAAAWTITNRLPVLVYQTLNIYAMPRLSSLGNDWNAITREQNEALRLGLALMAPVLCLAIAASRWIVPVLLSHAFLPAARILEIMFVGELLSVVFWTLSIGLFSTGRAAKFAAAEWGLWVVLLGCAAAMAPIFGLRAIAFAYVAAQGAMVAAMYLWERRERGFSWTRANVRLLAVSGAAVVVVTLTAGVATPIRVGFAVGVVAIWTLAGLTRAERIRLARVASRIWAWT